jgi:hypothetical protein
MAMRSRLTPWLAGVAFMAAVESADAQELRPVVFGTAALANLYRAEDQSFGTRFNVGGGAGFEWARLGLDAEIHRTLGLEPRDVPCSVVGVPCAGSAREGFLAATILSGNVRYFFGESKVRPYVTGSIGVLWTDGVNSITTVAGGTAVLSEVRERDAGLAVGGGFGVDIPMTPALSLRPEFRTYSSVALSRVNLGLHRGMIAVRYGW